MQSKKGSMSREEVEAKTKEIAKLYYNVFNSPEGKTVLENLRAHCWWKDPIFDPAQPEMTEFKLGERNVILYIDYVLEQAKNYI